MLLKDLTDELDAEEIIGDTQIDIEKICCNSKEVIPGSLFICIEGIKTDGHLYIREAVSRGAKAVIIEKKVPVEGGITVIKVKNTRKALAHTSNLFFSEPSKKMTLIGVTGTNGKTSVTYMLKKILEKSGRKTGLIGTIANWIGDYKIEAVRTTPESLDLHELFQEMVHQGVDSCVMEVSSHSLELERVENCYFDIGIFTNLTSEHLDFHKSIQNYRNAKKKLFYKTSQCNIINIDDLHGRIIAEEIKNLKNPLLTYGAEGYGDIRAENIVISMKKAVFDLITPSYRSEIEINISGMFTVYNALASIAAAYSMGIPLKDIKEGISEITGIPGRLETVTEIKDFLVIIDYAHTPDALENVLTTIKDFKENRIITVFGCGGDRDQSKRAIMGEIAGKYSDLTIVTSDNPRSEDPVKIMEMIEEGLLRTSGAYYIIEDRRKAIQCAIEEAEPGNIVLIAGKGHETTQVMKDQVFYFDDRKAAIEAAREAGLIL